MMSTITCLCCVVLFGDQQASLPPFSFSSNFRLRQSLSQHGIWRPAQIGFLLLSLPQRSREPDCLTWQTETATRERTSSSVTENCGKENCGQEPAPATVVPGEQKQNNFMKTLRSTWKVLLAGILIAFVLGSVAGFFTGFFTAQTTQAHMASNTNLTLLSAQLSLQRSILLSDKLSFLWRLCDKDTLQCSRCLPGWLEHASRCFFLSQTAEKWQKARRICMDMGGDLAVVLNAEDQEFLTNMTFEFAQQHPQIHFLSAWIGLQDMVKEGVFIWVNGKKVREDVKYWRPLEPNNAVPSWAKDEAGQDCVVIVPPSHLGQENWLNSWDDIICGGKRHYLCESTALILSGLT